MSQPTQIANSSLALVKSPLDVNKRINSSFQIQKLCLAICLIVSGILLILGSIISVFILSYFGITNPLLALFAVSALIGLVLIVLGIYKLHMKVEEFQKGSLETSQKKTLSEEKSTQTEELSLEEKSTQTTDLLLRKPDIPKKPRLLMKKLIQEKKPLAEKEVEQEQKSSNLRPKMSKKILTMAVRFEPDLSHKCERTILQDKHSPRTMSKMGWRT